MNSMIQIAYNVQYIIIYTIHNILFTVQYTLYIILQYLGMSKVPLKKLQLRLTSSRNTPWGFYCHFSIYEEDFIVISVYIRRVLLFYCHFSID
jgi:hypothetical protein